MIVKTDNRVLIRVAEPNDLPELFRLVDSYEMTIEADRDLVKNNLRDLLYIHGVMLGECNGQVIGGVAGYALPCMFTNETLFACMFLYIKKEHRHLTKRFIQELELTFLPTKAKRLTFSTPATPEGDKLQRFFRSLGYSELETHFSKRF